MSNCQDMTTATCQSTRIVLGVETIPIHQYILRWLPYFFDGYRHYRRGRSSTKMTIRYATSEKYQASITRNERNEGICLRTETRGPQRRSIDFLSPSRVYDISSRFDDTRNVSRHALLTCRACLPRPIRKLDAAVPCCLDIGEKRKLG